MLLKIKDSEKCDYDTALAWAVSAKNSLISHSGFSPSQLVFGQNPSLPNYFHYFQVYPVIFIRQGPKIYKGPCLSNSALQNL